MIKGGCRCGRVRYESDGKAMFSVICHCRDCQRASGSFGLPVMGVSRSTFKVTGDPKCYSCMGGSGRPALRYFCGECGSLLFGRPEIVPEVVAIYVGTLDDPNVFHPREAIFTQDRPHWARRAEKLVEYANNPR